MENVTIQAAIKIKNGRSGRIVLLFFDIIYYLFHVHVFDSNRMKKETVHIPIRPLELWWL